MKRILQFSKYFLPAIIISTLITVGGIVGYFVMGGFNLGVDFQAGLIQEVQFAPSAFSLTYTGKGVAAISMDKTKLDIVVSGSDVEKATHSFPYATYSTLGSLVQGLATVEGLNVSAVADSSVSTVNLVQSAQGNPQLGTDLYTVHYLNPGSTPIPIKQVRDAVSSAGSVSVQSLGKDTDRRFMIRVEDKGTEAGFAKAAANRVESALAKAFGNDQVAIARTDYVGARFSKQLASQAGLLMGLTLLLILIYMAFRFKFDFAFGAVLATAHDAFIMVAFIVWTRMEFNTTTIAAILTILGYSINDTIVIFDRIRETVRLHPDLPFEQNMNQAITDTLSRTFITTLTTMLAVFSLFIFTTGSMKDFAFALLIGMTSGVYSTIFIASAFVHYWERGEKKRALKKTLASSSPVPKKA